LDTFTLIRYWVLLSVAGGLLHLSVMWLWTGKLWPVSQAKVNPVLATLMHIIGWTGVIVYGTQDLLQVTISALFP
jgi:hypothetical protein